MRGETEWVLVGLDEKLARRQGLPACLPIPRGALEALAGASVDLAHAREWIKAFLASAELDPSGPLRDRGAALAASLEAFLKKAPLWDEARQAFADGAYDRASDALRRIVAMDAEDHAARLNLALAQANLGEHASALRTFQGIKTTFDGDADYHVAVGQVLMALERSELATEQFFLALGAEADCQPALDALVQLGLLCAIEGSPGDAASLTYVRADKLVDYVTEQWDAEPRRVEFYLEQLERHASEHRHAVVLAAAERALRLAPVPLERAACARVAALRALGRLDEATARAKEHLAMDPASAAAKAELACCYLAAGERALVGDALALFAEALRLAPGDAHARAAYWTGLIGLGRFADVLADAARLAAPGPADWRLRLAEVEARAGLGRTSEARAAFLAMDADASLPVAVRERARSALRALGDG